MFDWHLKFVIFLYAGKFIYIPYRLLSVSFLKRGITLKYEHINKQYTKKYEPFNFVLSLTQFQISGDKNRWCNRKVATRSLSYIFFPLQWKFCLLKIMKLMAYSSTVTEVAPVNKNCITSHQQLP